MSCASRAEIDALGAVIAAAAAMAEQVKSEAATLLLHRALALVRERDYACRDDPERQCGSGDATALRPS